MRHQISKMKLHSHVKILLFLKIAYHLQLHFILGKEAFLFEITPHIIYFSWARKFRHS